MITQASLGETLDRLRDSSDRERVVLWLGREHGEEVRVHEVNVPIQEAEADYFRIPQEGMRALFSHLRSRRLMVAAQVHTHPEEAFHSPADDRWAIVRHRGALSLVVPRFCQDTTVTSFVRAAKVYQLTPWDEFVEALATSAYEIIP